MRGRARIITMQNLSLVCQRPDHEDFLHVRSERQRAIILQQHHGFLRGLERKLPVSRTVDFRRGRIRVGDHVGRIEHPQSHASGKQALQRAVKVGLGHEALVHGVNKRTVIMIVLRDGEEIRTLVVHAMLHGDRGGLGLALGVMMPLKYIDHGIAVGYHVAVELPCAAQGVDQQEIAGAGRLAVYPVVGAHDGLRLAFGDGCAECRQVSIFHVMFRDLHINGMPGRLRPAVHRIMFGRRNHAVILRIVALQPRNKSDTHASG